jgi:hypothetical protein
MASRRESHPRPLQERQKAAPPCVTTMAGRHPLGPLAIRPQERSLPSQYLTCPGRQNLKSGVIQLHWNRKQDEAPSCFWLPSVCIRKQSGSRKFNPALVTTCMPRCQFGSKSFAHQKCLPGTQPTHRHVSPQYHCRFDNFFEPVRHGGPDVSVPMAWQQLSGLTVMSQTPSMEYHDEIPRPSECMQFGNNPIAPTQETDNTLSFGDTAYIPIFFDFDQHMQDFSDNRLLQRSMREKWLHINLFRIVQSSQVSQ